MTVYTTHLKLRKPDIGQSSWGDEMHDNIDIEDFILGGLKAGNVVLSGCAPSDGGGLDVDYAGGEVSVNGTRHTITGGSKTCSAEQKNWLCVDASGVVQLYTTAPTAAYTAIAMIDAGATTLDRIADCRKLAEGAAAFDLEYDPDNYEPDTGESKEIEQHLAGIDTQLGLLLAGDLIINGSMQIAQLGSSFTGLDYSDYGEYTLDQYMFSGSGASSTAVMDIKQTADHPSGGPGKCLEIDITTADTSLGSTVLMAIGQRIEAQFLLFLEYGQATAKDLILGFWAKADSTGVYPLSLIQNDASRCYVTTFTINAANTWEFKTIVIPGDTSGQIDNDNGAGLQLSFALARGSNFETSTTEAWQAGSYFSTPGAINLVGSASGNLRIAEVRLQPGSVYIPSPPRLHPVELFLCQRYIEKGWYKDQYYSVNAQYVRGTRTYKATKRASPSLSYSNLTTSNCTNFNLFAGTSEVTENFEYRATMTVSSTFLVSFDWVAKAVL